MRKKLVAPMAALVVGAAALAVVLHATLTRLPEVDAEPEASPAPVELEAFVLKSTIKVGERLPVEFRLRNVSGRPVLMLPALHKSDIGARYPVCLMVIRDAEGRAEKAAPGLAGGNINPLRAGDFLTLAPGEVSAPLLHYMQAWKPDRPGTYSVRFTYDASPKSLRAWGVPDRPVDASAAARLQRMPRLLLSASTTLHVDP